MMNYGKLIESHMISFKEVMVTNYKLIGLDETEAMIIMLLYSQKKHKNNALSVKNISQYVTVDENQLSKIIVELVEKDFIELTIEDNNEEHFSLAPTIEKLGRVLEAQDKNKIVCQDESSKIISFLETAYQKQLSPADLLVVQKWIREQYEFKNIMDAVNESIRLNRLNIKYADAILVNRTPREKTDEIDPEIQEVLKQINVKR